MKRYAAGRIDVRQGASLWIGRTYGKTDTHAHHAIQISLALEGAFRVWTPKENEWRTYGSALIPSHRAHALSADAAAIATTFVEPEANEGQVLLDHFATSGVATFPDGLAAEAKNEFRSACGERIEVKRLVAAAHEVVRVLTGGADGPAEQGLDASQGRAASRVIHNCLPGGTRHEPASRSPRTSRLRRPRSRDHAVRS